VSHWTERSSLLLSDSGEFAMQNEMPSSRPYLGAYQREGNRITFAFSDYGPVNGIAHGTLTDGGEFLEVRFNLWMGLSDFEDAVYRWVR
jgi:hypothetical protein